MLKKVSKKKAAANPKRPHPRGAKKAAATDGSYPVSALGPIMAAAVMEISSGLGAAQELVAQSVLAAAASAAQGLGDVHIDGRVHPISCFSLTIADSGERKTAADQIVAEPHRVWQDEQVKAHKDQEKSGRPPVILFNDVSYDGLVHQMLQGYPSAALFADEGGTFIGGAAMRAEAVLRTHSGLSSVWSTGTLPAPLRANRQAADRRGVRLSFHIMATHSTAARMLSNPDYWDQGMFSRCFVVKSRSLAGTRIYKAVDVRARLAVKNFHARIAKLLRCPLNLGAEAYDGVKPSALRLTKEAKSEWIACFNKIEQALGRSPELLSIKGMASKAPEMVLRVAAVRTLVQKPDATQIKSEAIRGAATLIDYYLRQAGAIRAEYVQEKRSAVELAMIQWFLRQGGKATRTQVLQRSPTRTAESADDALRPLLAAGFIQVRKVKGITTYVMGSKSG